MGDFYDSNIDSADYSSKTEISAAVFFLVGGFVAFSITYIFGACRNRSHNNFVMFYTLLMTYDWIFYIIFTIWTSIGGLPISVFESSITIFLIGTFLNSLSTIIILHRECKHNEQFRVWFQDHKRIGTLVAFCSIGNVNVLHVLNCKYNFMDQFDAKLSPSAEKRIIHGSVISFIFGDLFKFFLLLVINSNLSRFYAIPVISLFLNWLVLIFGFLYRIYESMIRGYEPIVEQFIVNKKQFLEA